MAFVKVHKKDTDFVDCPTLAMVEVEEARCINTDTVECISAARNRETGSIIHFTSGHFLYVTETVDELLKLLESEQTACQEGK